MKTSEITYLTKEDNVCGNLILDMQEAGLFDNVYIDEYYESRGEFWGAPSSEYMVDIEGVPGIIFADMSYLCYVSKDNGFALEHEIEVDGWLIKVVGTKELPIATDDNAYIIPIDLDYEIIDRV